MSVVSPARPDFQVVDENLRAAMSFFGQATGKGQVDDRGGLELIFSGMDYGVFNIAMLTGPPEQGGLAARVQECAEFFRPRTTRWSFWLCEGWLEKPAANRARLVLAEQGMRSIAQPPGMLATALRPPERKLPDIECRPVNDVASRLHFAEITGVCFDIPSDISQQIYQNEGAWNGSYRGYLGLVRGVPVAIAAVVAAGGVLGVYSLATRPEHRGRGYGEALLRAAVGIERARTGMERVALQSTEAGYRLYRRLGFRDVSKYSVYLTR